MFDSPSYNKLININILQRCAIALRDVVDIKINDNQNVITLGRMGSEKTIRTIGAIAVFACVVWYVVMNFSLLPLILGLVIMAVVCWYLAETFQTIVVDIPRKKISASLFNIILNEYSADNYRGALVYMLSLNGREPSPKEFCLKFVNKGQIREVHLADLTKGSAASPADYLRRLSKLWNVIEEFMLLDQYVTEYRISARNAIFG